MVTPNPSRRLALHFAVFLSGLSALMYEVTWMRMLTHVIGSTVFSVTTVLCVFMAGLALGGFCFGGRADRWRPVSALRAYGAMQIGIAVLALLVPVLLAGANAAYVAMYRGLRPSFGTLMGMRMAASALILFPPAFLMGGTLPALCCYAARRGASFARDAGVLYAVNTAGGLAGCAAAGFAFIEAVGLRGTSQYAALLSAIAGGIAWALARRAEGPAEEGDDAPGRSAAHATQDHRPAVPAWAAALAAGTAAVSGLAAMGYQVLWTRAYLFFMGTTVYAFTIILMTFLFGLALGALALARLGDRAGRPGVLLGLAQVGIGLWGCVSCVVMCMVFRARAPSAVVFQGASLAAVSDGFLAAAAGMLVPTVLMGASLPLAMAWYRAWRGTTGRSVGMVAGANALGSALGPAVAGFLLIPWLGVDRGITVFACTNIVVGLVVIGVHRAKAAWLACAIAAAAAVGLTAQAEPFLDYAKWRTLGQVLHIDEGPDSTITISENEGQPLLTIDGTPMAASDRGMRWRAHLPMALHADPRKVLVVGCGTGTTAGTAAERYPRAHVDLVELSKTVVSATRFFRSGNHDLLHHPRVRIIVEDARNYMAVTDKRYDVIIVDAPHPFTAHASTLFGREFYQACAKRLADRGIFLQWIPLYLQPAVALKRMVRTFHHVFPECTMWGGDDINMVAVRGPLRISMSGLEERVNRPGFQQDLKDKSFTSATVMLSKTFLMGPGSVSRFAAEGPIVTDDHPSIEFTIPRHLRDPGPRGRVITWAEVEQHLSLAHRYLAP